MNRHRLVLASSSRYRRALLERLGVAFDVMAPDLDEAAHRGEPPMRTATRLAEAKARAVAARCGVDALVIGSDQVADCEGVAVSKPTDPADAVRMLQSLSSRTIVWHTALVLLDARSGRLQSECVDVSSTFLPLSREQIDAYLAREQPYDCAGAVRSEALGIALFERITSDDPTALIGLPLIALSRMLRNVGFDVLAPRPGADGR
jgi:septum formation protein